MSYAAWSVVFGEQPSAAKWNILGTNDSSFNDGTGIANMEVGSGHTSMKLDYKFRVYRNAALNTGNGAFAIVTCDTKSYDTSSNVDVVTNKGRFTAPVAGFYHFSGEVSVTSNADLMAALFKNGSVVSYGTRFTTAATLQNVVVSDNLQLAANDFVELNTFSGSTKALEVSGAIENYFTGFLISQT